MAALIADIKLGYTCNNDCIHCVISSQREKAQRIRGKVDLQTKEYLNSVEQSMISGCKYIVVTGGEPTIRDDFFEIIDYIHRSGLKIILQTNGRCLHSPDFFSKIKKYPVFYVVALHSINEKVHDNISQRNNSYQETWTGIQRLLEHKKSLLVKCVLTNHNYKEMKEFVRILFELGTTNFMFSFPHAQGNAWINRDEVVPLYEDIIPHLRECIHYVEEQNQLGHSIKLRFETIPFCHFEDGKQIYAQEWYHNQDHKVELKQLDSNLTIDWSKQRGDIKIHPYSKCETCVYLHKCEGVWDDYYEILRERGMLNASAKS